MFISYMSLFGFFYLVGSLDFFARQKPANNGYKILGSLGTISLLITLSFDWFWRDLGGSNFQLKELITAPEFFAACFTTILAAILLYLHLKSKPLSDINPLSAAFILFIVIFILGLFSPFGGALINLAVLAIGILIIRQGARQDDLGILNFGLMVITALVVCRFFDSNLSFVIRGFLFLSVGAGFFVTNYMIIKKRKTNES